MSDDDLYPIGTVADAFGLSISALRYYDDEGLLPATLRRGRVRYYDNQALMTLAYLQLWHDDGMMSIATTKRVMAATTLDDRLAHITTARDEITVKIAGLRRAEAILTHMLDCRTARPFECPMTGDHLRRRVDAALHDTDLDDGFLPSE